MARTPFCSQVLFPVSLSSYVIQFLCHSERSEESRILHFRGQGEVRSKITDEGSERSGVRIDSPVAGMPGIGPKLAMALEARGIASAGDLVFHLPVRYQDWRGRSTAKDLRAG